MGPYRLLEQIGEGGMGVVYLAEQREPVRRRVAVKIMRPGLDSARFLARFEAERQALALMEHSCIARVFDAGSTETGHPFLAMEYVKGVPITSYCDTSKLGLKGRIQLFLLVCSAVQHAHTKGVMHRDLKPSNILVSDQEGVPTPKVIDFGLAKALDHRLVDATVFTEQGQILGTLEYMSPEQAGGGGLDVDMRTDIYSLGVVLYQLLTGTLPLARKDIVDLGWDEVRRLIREGELQKPSTRVTGLGEEARALATDRGLSPSELRRNLRGELDWVVMKALDKNRIRRYTTVAEFAADLERYIRNEPVSAGPPSAAYILRKTLQRHRALVAGGAVVAAAIGAGVAVALNQAILKEQAIQAYQGQRQVLESLQVKYRQFSVKAQLFKHQERYRRIRDESPQSIEALGAWIEGFDKWVGSVPDLSFDREALVLGGERSSEAGSPDDLERDFLLAELDEVLEDLQLISNGHRSRVLSALDWAKKVESETCGAYAEQWRVCKSEVAGQKDFAGLDLKPQVGLVPLGADPKTGLQEFWFMRSGDRPQRGADGRYEIEGKTGMIFVLLPGGSFTMGDAVGLPNERPPHQVRLGPFFLSKYEMTQAQWARWTGQNPSRWQWPTRPVASVSFEEAMRELQWRGLTLPTEAQWEFACRAGAATRWFYGNQRESLLGENGESLVNIASGVIPEAKSWPGYSDPYEIYAPVGVFPANAFGLHEMHGNVAEICRGPAVDSYQQARHATEDGLLAGDSTQVVQRGGSWYKPAEDARCAYRIYIGLTEHMDTTGVRPARAIDP